jgi:hypothetical protein
MDPDNEVEVSSLSPERWPLSYFHEVPTRVAIKSGADRAPSPPSGSLTSAIDQETVS